MNMFINERVHKLKRSKIVGLMVRKKEKTKKIIHQNALKLFKNKGLKKIRMRDIAKKSNIAVGTLYNYYKSKNSLIISILEEKFKKITLENRGIIEKIKDTNYKNPLDILYTWIDKYVEIFFLWDKEIYKELFKIMFSNEQFLKRGIKLDEMALNDLKELLEYMQNKNLIKKNIDIEKASFSIYSMFFVQTMGYLYYFKDMKKKDFRNEMMERIKMFYE